MTAPSSVSKPPGYDRRRYVHVAQSDQVTDLRTDLTMSPAALVRRLDGIQPEDWSAQAWLFAGPQAIQKVDAYGFFPNQPQIVEQDGAPHTLTRAELERDEVNILRGILTSVQKSRPQD